MAAMTYDMDELVKRSGVAARTIRHWVGKRLIPKPRGIGRGALYDGRHLCRVRAIKALRAQDVPLASIRARLAGLDDKAIDELARASEVPSKPEAAVAPAGLLPNSPPEPVLPRTASCEIFEIMDGVAIMFDRSRGMLVQRVVADIYRNYSHKAVPGAG